VKKLCNWVPLLLMTHSFTRGEFVQTTFSHQLKHAFTVLLHQLRLLKDSDLKMDHYCRFKNLIQALHHLSFAFLHAQTEDLEPHVETYNDKPENRKTFCFNSHQVLPTETTSQDHSKRYLVRPLKHCNFCGHKLTLPAKFALLSTCPKCAFKSANTVFPYNFLPV